MGEYLDMNDEIILREMLLLLTNCVVFSPSAPSAVVGQVVRQTLALPGGVA